MKQGKLCSVETEWKKAWKVLKINIMELRETSGFKGKKYGYVLPRFIMWVSTLEVREGSVCKHSGIGKQIHRECYVA